MSPRRDLSSRRFRLVVALLAAALAVSWPAAGRAASPEVRDLEQLTRRAIDAVAPSVVQVIVPEMTKEQIEEAKRRDRERRMREFEEPGSTEDNGAVPPAPADETMPPPEEPAPAPEPAPPAESPAPPDDTEGQDKKDDAASAEAGESAPQEGNVRTGLIVSADGYVITSLVNVGRQTEGIRVRLADGRELPAARLGEDLRRDLVLLKIEASGLPVPPFAPKTDLAVGQWVVALGRALPINQTTASKGIVSALGRMAGVAIQTDANVSQMNYGGPLVDLEGRAAAIIVAVGRAGSTSQAEQFSDSGIGFAIPIQDVQNELADLGAGRRIEVPFLGVEFNLLRIGRGAQITFVFSTTAAKAAGLKVGDIIVKVNDVEIASPFQLLHQIGAHDVRDTIRLAVERDGETLALEATLGARPEYLPRR